MAKTRRTYDVFLVLHPFLDNIREFQVLSRPLGDLQRRYLGGADAYYCERIDTALIALRFPKRVEERWGAQLIHLLAARPGLPMVIPSTLSLPARREFFLEHLARYNTYLQHYPHRNENMPLVERAIINLADHLRSAPRPAKDCFFNVAGKLPLYHHKRRGVTAAVAV